jgi:hypothetical protein
MFISQGLVGPNPIHNLRWEKGKQVNIPVPVVTESRRFGIGRAGHSPRPNAEIRGVP